ncbi:MAG: protein kinase domain-containing protein, partial [Blastocatellia bacterium]
NRLGRKVALKLLPAEFVADSMRVRRFEREAKAASATAHPNIVSIYDIGQAENIHYIASEYVEGETLRRRIRRSNLQPIETLDIALQVANALASAHKAGFVHRDIKPENIMIRPDGFVKVLDFGLAAITKPDFNKSDSQSDNHITTNTDTLPGTIMGTVNYMSPEQVRGQKADARSDLWSLGIVMFEMLAGHAPFRGQSVPDAFVSILDRPPLPLKNAPLELEKIVHKLLAKEREDRYQTAQELAAELKSLKLRLEYEFDSQSLRYSSPSGESEHLSADTAVLQPFNSSQSGQQGSLATGRTYRRTAIGLAAILLLVLATGGYWLMTGRDAIDSIAIMPLVNQTNDASLEYITDGITETLIHNISQLPKLKVTSRTSVFRYKNQQKDHPVDPAEIGEKFDVRAILTGRVIKLDQTLV